MKKPGRHLDQALLRVAINEKLQHKRLKRDL